MKKRNLSALIALLLCVAMLAACGAPAEETESADQSGKPYAGKTLTLSIFAIMTDEYQQLVFDQFEELTGCEIVVELGSASERFAKIQNNPNSGIDVILLSQKAANQGYEQGLFEEIDYARLPNAEQLVSSAQRFVERHQAPPYELSQLGIIYDPKVVDPADIQDYTDIFNPKFASSVAIPGITSTYGAAMVDIAAKHAGVPFTEDKGAAAFAALEELKPNLVQVYSSSSEIKNMFATGEISIALAGNFAYSMLGEDTDLVWYVPESGGYVDFNTMNILKNSENKDLAYEFLNYMMDLETQTRFCDGLPSSGINAQLDPAIAQRHPGTVSIEVAEKSHSVDYAEVQPLFADWVDQWNRIMAN